MKKKSRELLINAKATRNWEDEFEQKVEELMHIVGMVDTPANLQLSTEVMDVYQHPKKEAVSGRARRPRKHLPDEPRPFEFLAFIN